MSDVLRSVLFVDFDNVFFSLQSADREAAKAFANAPQRWLDEIESGALIEEGRSTGGPLRRRILMRRCYANPAVMRYFRGWFTRSGFQIVDCPPLTGKGKNSADIYMVVDMLDAMRHETRFDEFIIMSGDADFTPVLTRLRAYDRRSVIYSNAVTASAYKSLCDGMITEERLIDLAPADEDDGTEARPERRAEPRDRPEPRAEARPDPRPEPRPEARPGFPAEPPRAERPVRRRPPPPPRPASPAEDGADQGQGPARLPRVPAELDPLVRRVAAATNVPPFAPEVYASIFRALASEVRERGFSLNRTVNGVIRRMTDQGMRLRPQAVAFVVKGLILSGHNFDPSDSPGMLAKAFRRQVLYLASNADLVLADAERQAVGLWIIGALRSVPASEAMEFDEIRSDANLAAEVAGVAIEETIHPLGPQHDLPAPEVAPGAEGDEDDGGLEGDGEAGKTERSRLGLDDMGGEDPEPDEGAPDERLPDDRVTDDTEAVEPEPDGGAAAASEARARPVADIDNLLARIRNPNR